MSTHKHHQLCGYYQWKSAALRINLLKEQMVFSPFTLAKEVIEFMAWGGKAKKKKKLARLFLTSCDYGSKDWWFEKMCSSIWMKTVNSACSPGSVYISHMHPCDCCSSSDRSYSLVGSIIWRFPFKAKQDSVRGSVKCIVLPLMHVWNSSACE